MRLCHTHSVKWSSNPPGHGKGVAFYLECLSLIQSPWHLIVFQRFTTEHTLVVSSFKCDPHTRRLPIKATWKDLRNVIQRKHVFFVCLLRWIVFFYSSFGCLCLCGNLCIPVYLSLCEVLSPVAYVYSPCLRINMGCHPAAHLTALLVQRDRWTQWTVRQDWSVTPTAPFSLPWWPTLSTHQMVSGVFCPLLWASFLSSIGMDTVSL